MPTVLISTSSFGRHGGGGLERLEAAGFTCRMNPYGRTLRPEESVELLRDADALIAGTEVLDRRVLSAAGRLRVISRCGGGLDGIDLEAARERGIVVRSTPGAPVQAVAELALAGILALLRHLATADRELRAGRWKKRMGRLLEGRRLGIVGLGRIGRRLSELLKPFHPELAATDPRPDREFARRHGILLMDLPALLGRSEVVTLHLPASDEGLLIGAAELAAMPAGALLVNTSRGGLVDEAALLDALSGGRLGGAYLDVFEREPYDGPLAGLPNVLLTPHIGSYAAESRARMESEAVDNLLLSFVGEGGG